MTDSTRLVRVAALIADPSRATMLDALFDGSAHSVGELAHVAHVSMSTASEHVGRLVDGGLVTMVRIGRRHVVGLRSADVAQAIEHLAAATSDSAEIGTTTAMECG